MIKLFHTRKIRLIVDTEDPEYRSRIVNTLYQWRHICFKASNLIYSHHYIQQQIRELIYLTDEVKVKLSDISVDEEGILKTSRMNTTYQVLARNFKGEVPMHVMSALNSSLLSDFNYWRRQYLMGERTLPVFKKDLPIPFKGTDVKGFAYDEEKRIFSFRLFDIRFRIFLGKDFTDKRVLLHKLLRGEVKLCGSSLVLERGKIFMLAVFETEPESHPLDPNVLAEASLSLDYPIIVTIGKSRHTIGSKEEFLYKRLAIQAAVKRKQKAMEFMNNRSRKKIEQETISNLYRAEKRYVRQKQHLYSRRLIDLCIENRAATLLLVGQTEKEQQAKEDAFLMRNWSYYGLKEKIERKAERAGIAVLVE